MLKYKGKGSFFQKYYFHFFVLRTCMYFYFGTLSVQYSLEQHLHGLKETITVHSVLEERCP